MSRNRILIIGLGKVGASYDFKNSANQSLSHLNSIFKTSKFLSLDVQVFGYDKSSTACSEAKSYFKDINIVGNYHSFEKNFFQLVIICTPIKDLFLTYKSLINENISNHYLIEKPGFDSLSNLELCKEIADSKLVIGFQRRCLPSTNLLKKIIDLKIINKKATFDILIKYEGEALNILGHFLDVIEYIFPAPSRIEDRKINGELIITLVGEGFEVHIRTKKISPINSEQSSISCQGDINFEYLNSGRRILFLDNSKEIQLEIDAEAEINQMIGFESIDYLSWSMNNKDSMLTKIDSYMLNILIKNWGVR
jgi:hypothetical protein